MIRATYRFLLVVVATGYFLMVFGCSESLNNPSQSGVPESTTRQRYPTGIDTVESWADGRYQIIVDAFYDEETKPDPCIVRLIRAYLVEGSFIYVRGKHEFVVLDYEKKSFQKYPVSKLPAQFQAVFERLRDGTEDKRVRFLPVINP